MLAVVGLCYPVRAISMQPRPCVNQADNANASSAGHPLDQALNSIHSASVDSIYMRGAITLTLIFWTGKGFAQKSP